MNLKIAVNTIQDETENKDQKKEKNISNLQKNNNCSSIYETSPANVIVNAGKENQNLKVKFGIVNNNVVDNKYVEMLANIPAREVLLSQLLGMLQAPIRNLACVLKAAADK